MAIRYLCTPLKNTYLMLTRSVQGIGGGRLEHVKSIQEENLTQALYTGFTLQFLTVFNMILHTWLQALLS